MRRICQRNVAAALNEVRDLVATLFAYLPSTSARAVSYHGGAWYGQSIHALPSAFPRGALHVAGCCSMEDARWRCEQLDSSRWTVVPESCSPPAVTQTCKLVSPSSCDHLAGWLWC